MSEAIILNVNDNKVARYTVTRMLQAGGFEVREAADGATALAAVATDPAIAVVVLDVRLPDLDGFEVCRRIKGNPRTAATKVLHTSATYTTADNRVSGFAAGADAYLTQPFEAQEIVATVKALLRLKETEGELRAKAEMLADADRRKDEFLAMLAHELRNPLAVVATSLPLLERHPPRDETEARTWAMLRRQTEVLRRLVDDLLDVSRVTQGRIELRRETLDLGTLLEGVVAGLREREPARPVTVNRGAGSLRVEGDAPRLEQVFSNLLDNARKYSEPGTAIDVLLQTEGGKVTVAVRDRGFGIAAEELPHVFQLFAQSHHTLARSSGGLGIGLTLVKRIVELHGGTVEARSEGPGRGSEFTVTLPALAQSGDCSAASRQPARAQAGPLRVLVIEDNADVRESIEALFEMWGHDVLTASDGRAGLARALEEQPDLALVDVGLPELDGYEVAQSIRADGRGRDLFLVALTGYGAVEHRQKALGAGFDMHLVKPVDPDQLAAVVTRAHDKRAP